jgi:hypothetical protein
MRRKSAVTITLALGLLFAGVASAAPTFWSETYAEKIVRTKLHLPCASVIPTGEHLTCNVAKATALMASAKASYDKCKATPPVPGRTSDCYEQAMYADMAGTNLKWARNGFRPTMTTCTGTGQPDSSGYRFAAFRCVVKVKLTVDWSSTWIHHFTITGRIALWPTGPASARWKLI